MKNKLILSVTIGLLACVSAVRAQTNTSEVPNQLPPVEQQFYTTAFNWLTSVNTNYSWDAINLEIATGYKQVTGIGAASTLEIQYDIARFNVGAAVQFSGVGSALNGAEGQIGYAVIADYDVKLETDLRVGYDGTDFRPGRSHGFEIEPAIFITKLMTKTAYSRLGLSLPLYFKGPQDLTPSVYIELGFGHLK